MPLFLAREINALEHSRTCPMLPGAEGMAEVCTVCMESTTSTAGLTALTCSKMRSSDVSLSTSRFEDAREMRCPRILTCCSDSSPET